MLLMYIDLLSVGVNEGSARQFYSEIKCLSRANARWMDHIPAIEVCFYYDYSQYVGTLLARYIAQDLDLGSPLVSEKKLNESLPHQSRLLFGRVTDTNRGSFLLNLFRHVDNVRTFPKDRKKLMTSCCTGCHNRNYFVYLEEGVCMKDPFGKNCCHKGCMSLRHLKIGVGSSMRYCCRRCQPQICRR